MSTNKNIKIITINTINILLGPSGYNSKNLQHFLSKRLHTYNIMITPPNSNININP